MFEGSLAKKVRPIDSRRASTAGPASGIPARDARLLKPGWSVADRSATSWVTLGTGLPRRLGRLTDQLSDCLTRFSPRSADVEIHDSRGKPGMLVRQHIGVRLHHQVLVR